MQLHEYNWLEQINRPGCVKFWRTSEPIATWWLNILDSSSITKQWCSAGVLRLAQGAPHGWPDREYWLGVPLHNLTISNRSLQRTLNATVKMNSHCTAFSSFAFPSIRRKEATPAQQTQETRFRSSFWESARAKQFFLLCPFKKIKTT